MENLTIETEQTTVEPTTKREWVTPEMVEIEVIAGPAAGADSDGLS